MMHLRFFWDASFLLFWGLAKTVVLTIASVS